MAGWQIILLREKMGEMQNQIQKFIATLNRELVARTPSPVEERTSLIPVINAKLPARRR